MLSTSLEDFLAVLAERMEGRAEAEAIPEGVRFDRRRGEARVLVIEEKPQVRTVRWLDDDSPAPFGRGAVYRTARLAFPFVVAIVGLRRGALTGYQECFYRTEPLRAPTDTLCLSNLYNVASGHGQQSWICLASITPDFTNRTWDEKVREIRRHLWGAGFNRSSEVHEGMSYWGITRSLDRRIRSLQAWEDATKKDPFFPLRIAWKPAGRTVDDVVDTILSHIAPPSPTSLPQLVQLAGLARARRAATAGHPPAEDPA